MRDTKDCSVQQITVELTCELNGKWKSLDKCSTPN